MEYIYARVPTRSTLGSSHGRNEQSMTTEALRSENSSKVTPGLREGELLI